MNLKKAINIAVGCIQKEMQKIVFDANSALQGTQIPYQQKCQKRYTEMTQAIKLLEDIKQDAI